MSALRPIIASWAIMLLCLLCATLQVQAQFNAMAPPSSWSWSFDGSTGDSSYNYDETNLHNPTNIMGLPNPVAVYLDDDSTLLSSEIRFKGTAIERYEATGAGEASYWIVTVDEKISGPDPLFSPLKVITYQAISPPVWGETDSTIKVGDKVDVYGKYEEPHPSFYQNCYVTLHGSEDYYLRKVADSGIDKCGDILDYSISSGKNYPRGQMILADMKYKTNLDTATYFKGILKAKSPTGEVYIGEEVQKTFGFGTDHIDKFGYNKGNAIELRIPENAAIGPYSAKLELRRDATNELCDETGWLQDQFVIKEESLGNCIDFDELEPYTEISGQTLHYDQVDFVASSKSSVYIGELSHSRPNGISLFNGGRVTIFFKVPTSDVSLWAGDWAGGTKISVYDDSRGVLLEEIEPQTDWHEYRFSYPEAEISSIGISSSEGAFDDVCFSSSEARPSRPDSSDNRPPLINDVIVEFPQYGGEMTFAVDATDLDGDAIFYQFWLKGPSTGDMWKVMRSWSENNVWTWPLSSSDIGWNSLRVWARDGKHSDINYYDSEKMILGGNFYYGGDDRYT